MLSGKSIIITGGTGSFGKKFVKTILARYPRVQRVVVFSRDKLKQLKINHVLLTEKYPPMWYFMVLFEMAPVSDDI